MVSAFRLSHEPLKLAITGLFMGSVLLGAAACTPQPDPDAEMPSPAAVPAVAPALAAQQDPYAFDVDVAQLRTQAPVSVPDGCTVIDRRTTISAPGRYCLANHIIVDAENLSGIVIASDDVTLDLNGRTIVNALPTTFGSGVRADGVDNLVVENGKVHNFLNGVGVRGAGAVTVRSVDASGSLWRGFLIEGESAEVTDSVARHMPGYDPYENSPPVAIHVNAPTCLIARNAVGSIRSDRGNKFIFKPNSSEDCLSKDNTIDASDDACISVSQPMSIEFSGNFCLAGNISVADGDKPGLSVNASDVNIDLRGYGIFGPGPLSVAPGIHIANASNVQVSNGSVRGFDSGVTIERGRGVALSDLTSAYHNSSGFTLSGDDIVVENVTIRSIVGRGEAETRTLSGIRLDGTGIQIRDSEIRHVVSSEGHPSLAVDNSANASAFTFTDNRVSDVAFLAAVSSSPDQVTGNTVSVACGVTPLQREPGTLGRNDVTVVRETCD